MSFIENLLSKIEDVVDTIKYNADYNNNTDSYVQKKPYYFTEDRLIVVHEAWEGGEIRVYKTNIPEEFIDSVLDDYCPGSDSADNFLNDPRIKNCDGKMELVDKWTGSPEQMAEFNPDRTNLPPEIDWMEKKYPEIRRFLVC